MGKVSMPQGKGSQLHNRREYEKIGKPIPDNIDSSKTAENITLVDRDIRQVYQEIFGDALEQYNSKQKRADRKIEDYYDHIQKSKTEKSCSTKMWCSGAVKMISRARNEGKGKESPCAVCKEL